MPTTDAPTYYEHSKGIASSNYDHFFKWFPYDFYVESTGHVEAPIGYVALLEVSDSALELYDRELGDCSSPTPEWGWYVTRLDENGLIWAMVYGTGTLAEEGARADFAEAAETYAIFEGYTDDHVIDYDENGNPIDEDEE